MFLFLIDYTDCVSILAVPFHMRENPIELFKENADIESNRLQPALKRRDFGDDNSFPMILEENSFILTIENTSIAKRKILLRLLCFCCAVIICSTYRT